MSSKAKKKPANIEVAAPLGDHVSRFLVHLESERRLSAHSVAAYARDLKRLTIWCQSRKIKAWQHFNSDDARTHAAVLRQSGLSGRSIHRALSVGRTFFTWLRREQLVEHEPFAGVSAPKSSSKLPETLTIEEVEQLVEHGADDKLAFRDRAMFELVYSSGLRLSELVAVNLEDLEDQEQILRVLGKGSKTRLVPVGRQALSAIADWLKIRPDLAVAGENALFVGRHGRRLSPRAVQKRLKRLSVLSSLPQDVHPHMLRHSFASHLLQSSGDLRAVQELLGHANIATTQIYTHLDYQHLAKVYDASHPRAKRQSKAKNSNKS